MAKTGKIIVHGCGGGGISIADKVLNAVADLGKGFSELEFNYIDTSKANIEKVLPRGDFWLVTNNTYGGAEIDGSGSERRKNVDAIAHNMGLYLDDRKFFKRETGAYHMVVCSASGGSGGTIGSMLIKNLLERNIPVIAIVVGDSSNGLSAKNTKNTLATLNGISKATKKALSVVYVNNYAVANSNDNKVDLNEAEKLVNKQLTNTIASISLFLSNQHESLDDADMINMVDQSNYTTIEIAPGMYGMTVYSKQVIVPKGCVPTVGRTLTSDNSPSDTGLTLLHTKKGRVVEENIKDIFGEQFPLHLIMYANFFAVEDKALAMTIEAYDDIQRSIANEEVTGTKNSAADDYGIVF